MRAIGSTRETQHAVAAPLAGGQTFDIPSFTGDELCRVQKFVPDTIKIDVEGHEMKVLAGLTNILAQHKPMVFLEIHPARIAEEGDSLRPLCDLVSRLGYEVYRPDGVRQNAEMLLAATSDTRVVLIPVAR